MSAEPNPRVAETRECDHAGACIVIPVLNNAATVADAVRGARQHASTVIVCDDGSTDGSGARAREAGAEVIGWQQNRGKGAALRALLAEASRRGFAYAFSMDADGQHRPMDLLRLCGAVATSPGALVVGARDLAAAGAPARSQFGRRFSNFWVWLESGQRVGDSQSGLRAYPLPETARLPVRSSRYGFEVEVLLRASWAGIPLRDVAVAADYPPDRVSHFKPFVDNVRISVLNALVCLWLASPVPLGWRLRRVPRRPGISLFALRRWALMGAPGPVGRPLAALAATIPAAAFTTGASASAWIAAACGVAGVGLWPYLAAAAAAWGLRHAGLGPLQALWIVVGAAAAIGATELAIRPSVSAAQRTWTGRSRGGAFGYWWFIQLTRLLGRGAAYAFLYFVTPYFVLFAPTARRMSAAYLDRALGPATGVARWVRTWRHIHVFAQCLVDRALLLSRGAKVFRCTHEGIEHIRAVAEAGRGAVLMCTHLGNWEVGSGLLRELFDIRLAIVAFRGEEEHVAQVISRIEVKTRPRLITMGEDELSSLEILRALREGWLVAVQGDRLVDDRTVRVPFLGRDAPWPAGPHLLGAIAGAPVIRTFALKVGRDAYRFVADPPEHLAFEHGKEREPQMREWLARYAHRVESLVREYPFQWFNFYDFWSAEPPPLQRGTTRGASAPTPP